MSNKSGTTGRSSILQSVQCVGFRRPEIANSQTGTAYSRYSKLMVDAGRHNCSCGIIEIYCETYQQEQVNFICERARYRDRRILLEKVADFARKAVKLAEPYKTLWRAIPRILLHFSIHIPNMHETYQEKY